MAGDKNERRAAQAAKKAADQASARLAKQRKKQHEQGEGEEEEAVAGNMGSHIAGTRLRPAGIAGLGGPSPVRVRGRAVELT
jgi:hypothetical protein